MSDLADTSAFRADTSAAACESDRPVGGFMRELAHELGNIAFPLRMIIELQNRSAHLSGDELREVLQNQVDALQAITRRLQKVGRCLSEGMEPDFVELQPRDVVDDAVDRQRNAALARSHTLSFDSPDVDALSVRGDRELLVQALSELIDNAVRFTPPGGSIEVGLELEGDAVEVLVRDNGPGVPEELQSRIFQPLVTGRQRMDFGSGLIGCGLALVRQVMAVHHGAAELRRTSPAGSEFVMIVPLHRRSPR